MQRMHWPCPTPEGLSDTMRRRPTSSCSLTSSMNARGDIGSQFNRGKKSHVRRQTCFGIDFECVKNLMGWSWQLQSRYHTRPRRLSVQEQVQSSGGEIEDWSKQHQNTKVFVSSIRFQDESFLRKHCNSTGSEKLEFV